MNPAPAVMSLVASMGRVPLWADVPDSIKLEVQKAAIAELGVRYRSALARIEAFERRVAARAQHLDSYKREHQRLTDVVHRLDLALKAAQRLR